MEQPIKCFHVITARHERNEHSSTIKRPSSTYFRTSVFIRSFSAALITFSSASAMIRLSDVRFSFFPSVFFAGRYCAPRTHHRPFVSALWMSSSETARGVEFVPNVLETRFRIMVAFSFSCFNSALSRLFLML